MTALAAADRRLAEPEPATSARDWTKVVGTIHRAVGLVPVLLAGSRATGAWDGGSDYDLVAVIPLTRIPWALPRLARARDELERMLGAPVSLNPLPRHQARRGASNLFVWKLHQEGLVLSMPAGFTFDSPPTFVVVPATTYSYLMTAVFLLLDVCGAPAPPDSWLGAGFIRGTRKVLLHVLQLRLLEEGRYAATLDEALPMVDGDERTRVAAATDRSESWFALRDLVLHELTGLRLPSGIMRAIARNAQYASLSRLRGQRRGGAMARLHPFEYELGDAAIGLLRCVDEDGSFRADALDRVAPSLPVWLHAPAGDWRGLRDVLRREWASAHALMGL